uniref:Protein kinase domain-containing protein n=1 Tax=viral metagenome TaxID=1070528 RepID=A0A6C0I640_9ZZZZ
MTDTEHIKYKTIPISENTTGKGTLIGQGGFGKVYKVTNDNHTFAVKLTNVFDREGNLIGQNLKEISLGYHCLNHYNIVKCTNVFVHEKYELVNSKYVMNMNIADFSFNELIHSKLSNTDRLVFFYPLLKHIVNGISYIHSNFISHGDIKPENILLFGNSDLLDNNWKSNAENIKEYLKTSTLKICDFGGINLEYNNTMDHTSTLHYRPPELFIKMNNKYRKTVKDIYGQFNDVWSIAITMLEFLTKTNIIEKLYKKGLKINEKEFLSRYFHCMKTLDIYKLLKNSGYDIENVFVKNIANILQLMLNKTIHERINIYNLSIYINYYINKYSDLYKDNNLYSELLFEPIPLVNNNIQYINTINKDVINIDYRKYSIDQLYKFMNIDEYSDPNDNQYLPLGLLLFDRLISKKILTNDNSSTLQYMYTKTLLECYYIASRYLLSDIDIIYFIEFLNIDIDEIHLDILEILKQLNYDIYRPTILTFINNQNNDIYHSQYIMDASISTFCDNLTINTDYNNTVTFIQKMVEFDCNIFGNILNTTINEIKEPENDDNIITDQLYIPLLKRDDYSK